VPRRRIGAVGAGCPSPKTIVIPTIKLEQQGIRIPCSLPDRSLFRLAAGTRFALPNDCMVEAYLSALAIERAIFPVIFPDTREFGRD
jgi:hypothetical protein